MTRLFGALCSGLACVVLVAGCSESFSLTDSSTPTPTPPTPEPTSSPTVTRETPEEFVRRWVEVDREMQNTGDTAEYRELSQGCRPCNARADQIEGIYRAGGYVRTDGWSVDDIKVTGRGGRPGVLATVRITSAPTEYRETADSRVLHLNGGELVELMSLKPRGSSWLLTDLEQQAQ